MPVTAPAFSLRPATLADEPFLRELFTSERSAEFAPLGLDGPALDVLLEVQYRAQQVGFRQQFPNAEFLILERPGKPFGRLTVDRSHELLTIVDIALTPSQQGQGLGTAVLRRLLDEAEAAGIPTELRVAVGSRALALYQRLGFRVISTSPTHCGMRRG